jgi:hypothetical protein
MVSGFGLDPGLPGGVKVDGDQVVVVITIVVTVVVAYVMAKQG